MRATSTELYKYKEISRTCNLKSVNNERPPPKKSLIDLLFRLPQFFSKAVTRTNILYGFHENGMIYTNFNKYPDFNKFLVTCRTNLNKEMYQLCIDSFDYLFQTFHIFSRGIMLPILKTLNGYTRIFFNYIFDVLIFKEKWLSGSDMMIDGSY